MRSTSYTRAAATGLALALGILSLVVAPAAAKPSDAVRRRAFSLFAIPIDILQVNNIFCPVSNRGKVCVNQNDNPLLEGGFWPRGTPDSYIYNSGLQIGGVIQNSPFTGGTADTIGVYFMDPRGSQAEGEGLTNVFNSANTSDQAAWPNGAVARDPSLYNPVLLGKKFVSQQDLWVRVWDGNPANTIGGSHPLGIVVDERGMAWNYPTGNEDIIYFIYTVYNVSASNPAKYNNPTIDPALQPEIAAIGAQFKSLNDQHYSISIPADGYAITSTFLAFFEDCDVGVNSASNYATANFVFNLSFCYKSDWSEPTWTFPTDIFSAPLFVGPGFTGVKYLKSPLGNSGQELGLTIFSNTGNPTSSGGAGYIDARGGKQLYRYLSGTSSPASGDNACTNQGNQLALRYCFLFQQPVDARFFMSSGPFTLPAGESRTIVVAYVQAAALGTQFTAGCAVGGDCHSSPPPSPADLATGADTIRTIDKLAGWVSATDNKAPIGVLTQDEVTTFSRTLFNKSLVAQTVFDNKFLLPFSPEQPEFFLIPGDRKATIAWKASATETARPGGGDPYFEVASNPASPLYDPNFRQYDVEGYRIYRGRSPSNLQLIAQFDYAGTFLRDYTGAFAYTADLDGDGIQGVCAPELGLNHSPDDTPTKGDCPVHFPLTGAPIDTSLFVDHPLAGDVIQVPLGGRVQLKDGSVLITKADTAVVGGKSGNPPLTDGGVSFTFVDSGLVNSFTYYYAVTAFDVNSFRSGPSSLESPKTTLKTVTPRGASPNVSQPVVASGLFGGDGTKLDPTLPYPTIDPATGTFSGNMPPANDGIFALAAVTEVLPQGDVSIRLDSLSAGTSAGIGTPPPTAYLTKTAGGVSASVIVPLPDDAGFSADTTTVPWSVSMSVPYDSAKARIFGLGVLSGPAVLTARILAIGATSSAAALSAGRFGNFNAATQYLAHSRWFNQGSAEPPQPTIAAAPDSSHNSGALSGVSLIWSPQSYRDDSVNQRFRNYGYAQVNWYPADFLVTWNADSSLTVFDSTNHGVLPYAPNGGSGWGFVNVAAFTTAGLTAANLQQTDAVPTNLAAVTYNHFYAVPSVCDQRGIACIRLGRKAQYEGLDMDHNGSIDHNGIALSINGEAFIMAMSAIPAAGTKWHLRAVTGLMTATCVPAIGSAMTSCSKYTFRGAPTRPTRAPGLTYKITVQTPYIVAAGASGDLSKVHTVPDPYYVTNALEISPNTKVLKFVHLPSQAIVRIYSTSGVLVRVISHNDPGGGGEESWNLRNRNNQVIASGVYFYHVEGPDGQTKVGRFTIVNFAR